MAYDSKCTAGFTIFPHIVAIVHTDPYVDLYHYYHRWTLAKVPRHFSFFYFFLANRSFAIFTNIDTMGVIGHGLSTAAHGQKTPIPGQRACFTHHGQLPTRSVRSNSSRGGDLHNNSPGRFEGVVAATTWGNQHCLYHHPRPEDARSGATRLMPTSWATPHLLGSIKFI